MIICRYMSLFRRKKIKKHLTFYKKAGAKSQILIIFIPNYQEIGQGVASPLRNYPFSI